MRINQVLLLSAALGATAYLSAQVGSSQVSTADVISMSNAGLSDQIIEAKIRAHNKAMDLTTEQMIELKHAKVSDAVVATLIDPAAVPAAIAPSIVIDSHLGPSGKPSGATTGLTGDPDDPNTSHDSGIYVYTLTHDQKPLMVELERTAYQGAKTGGMFTSAMTYGIAKAKSKAIVPGKAAAIRVAESTPTFYFYFDEKSAGLGSASYFTLQNISNPNQFALVKLIAQKSTREAEIGQFSMWGASSGNNKKDIMEFKSEKIRPGLYKVTVSNPLQPGEYCFMTAPVATSSYAGMAGTTAGANLFDFGIDK